MFVPARASRVVSTGPSQSSVNDAKTDIAMLEHEVERLLMITEALWQILKEKHGCDEEELMRRVAVIDLADGKLDGKVAKSPPMECPGCQRALNRRHHTCLYCGTQFVPPPFAR